jgi:hypothetical protein
LKKPPIAPVLGCVLVCGYWCCATCDAQVCQTRSVKPENPLVPEAPDVLVLQLSNDVRENAATALDPAPQEDPGARIAADVLVQQLGAASVEVRENAAAALEAMGFKAGKALAKYIADNLLELNGETQLEIAVTRMQSVTKAAIILGKIGKGIAEDDEVRQVIYSAAESKRRPAAKNERYAWAKLQMRLASIEALGKINEHRGGIFAKELDASELVQAKDACDASDASGELEKIAVELFDKLAIEKKPKELERKTEPTASPSAKSAAKDPKRDEDFYRQLKVLRESQTKIIEIAAQVKVAAPLSKTTPGPILSKLTDANELEKSVQKIYSSYLKATNKDESAKANTVDPKKDEKKTDAENGDGVPAAYDMLTEAGQLSHQLQSLCKEMRTLENDRSELSQLISDLGTIPEAPQLDSKKLDSDNIKAEAAKALNRIFSKPPGETPTADAAKKGTAQEE